MKNITKISNFSIVFASALFMSGCTTGVKPLSNNSEIEGNDEAIVVFKSKNENLAFWLYNGFPQAELISDAKNFGHNSALVTIVDGYGIQKIKANTTYYVQSYHFLMQGKQEGNYATCSGKGTIYFRAAPGTTNYISDVTSRFEDGKLMVQHRKGDFDEVKNYLNDGFPKIAQSVLNGSFTHATNVTTCDAPQPTVVPIIIPKKKK
jgi:hypothetical protein